VGSRLVDRLLAHPAFERASFALSDTEFKIEPRDKRACLHKGGLRDPAVRARLLANKPELTFHLAGIFGGAAESRYRSGNQRRCHFGDTRRAAAFILMEAKPLAMATYLTIIFSDPQEKAAL
jgi:hypothetical protein